MIRKVYIKASSLDIKINDKVKILKDIPSVDGMLHNGEMCKVTGIDFPDRDLRVTDSMGRIWYVNIIDVRLINT